MDFKKVKEFIDLAKAEGVQELKYEGKEFKFSVSFTSGSQIVQHTPMYAPQAALGEKPAQKTNTNPNTHEVKSPFVGTLYIAPSPGEPAFVKIGDRVRKGQTLCILEAMKIMNEIESDVDGELVEICLENESLVEYGEVLFRIKK
ncbi:MAG: acetyl-CoA carboxylase biotin carboxyl carrier protein [Bacteriovoracaceae bacterium]|nr:acetyl-CoA carboxylase biotin carboxyl carrier protein [Bacteriovoracaceae bacterium]